MEKGIIVLLAGATVLRLLPPLVITKEEIDAVVGALKDILGD
jgi:4-aminobutyrate aminotransferase-like enzyme